MVALNMVEDWLLSERKRERELLVDFLRKEELSTAVFQMKEIMLCLAEEEVLFHRGNVWVHISTIVISKINELNFKLHLISQI